ncbi:MAG: hypothetical protein AAF619_04050 [Pseudomonadota bacterium]
MNPPPRFCGVGGGAAAAEDGGGDAGFSAAFCSGDFELVSGFFSAFEAVPVAEAAALPSDEDEAGLLPSDFASAGLAELLSVPLA